MTNLWPDDVNALLGTMPDGRLAERLGIPAVLVKRQRSLLNIPPYQGRRARYPWHLIDPMLERASNREISRLTKVPMSTLTTRRNALDLPVRTFSWDASKDARLGTVPDTVLAREWGINCSTVRSRRKQLGRAPAKTWKQIRWSSDMINRLGKEADRRLAREWGVPPYVIQRKRLALSIPPYLKRARVRWTPEMDALLGMQPDVVLAEMWGTSPNSVGRRRKLLSIPGYRRGKSVKS